jgi:phospholipid transport system transporter-binding protein
MGADAGKATPPAVLEQLEDGRWMLAGELNLESVPALYSEAVGRFATAPPKVVDLQKVTRIDSAGVALIIDWIRRARLRNQSIQFRNVPRQMQSIAQLCGVSQLLAG